MSTLLFPKPEVRSIQFTVYARPEPQGSMKGFVLPGKGGRKPRAILTSDNKKLKPYRQELTNTALIALEEAGGGIPFAAKHVPVHLVVDFFLERPVSIPKKRSQMVVRPDASKLLRATEDALTGVLWQDDAQIVSVGMKKHYGTPERVEIQVQLLE